jgi:hypothetical protein
MSIFKKKTAIEQLEAVRDEMAVALLHQDWEKIGELDRVCRECVDKISLKSEGDERVLKAIYAQLLQLYDSLIQSCREQRDAIGNELIGVNRSTKGAKLYKVFG